MTTKVLFRHILQIHFLFLSFPPVTKEWTANILAFSDKWFSEVMVLDSWISGKIDFTATIQ